MKSHRQKAIASHIGNITGVTDEPERELTLEREAEVRAKFEKWYEIKKKEAYSPDFPPYQNLEVPVGCNKDTCRIMNDHWIFLGKRYEVSFTFELVFGSINARKKKFDSMQKKMEALMALSTLTQLCETPGFAVTDWKEVQNV